MQYKNNVASQINISLVGILGSISYVTCNIQLFLLSRKVGQSKATEMKVAAGMSKPASRFFSFLQATLVFASISEEILSQIIKNASLRANGLACHGTQSPCTVTSTFSQTCSTALPLTMGYWK